MKNGYIVLVCVITSLTVAGFFFGKRRTFDVINSSLISQVEPSNRPRNLSSKETVERANEIVRSSGLQSKVNDETTKALEQLSLDTIAEQEEFDMIAIEFRVELQKVQELKQDLDILILNGEDKDSIEAANKSFEVHARNALTLLSKMNEAYLSLQRAKQEAVSNIVANVN